LIPVREVYEHIYETVDVEGSPDIRASATAKATVAAFAASEGHAHPRYRTPSDDSLYGPVLWILISHAFGCP
jgi:hypothetical protein